VATNSRHDAWQAGESYDAYMGRWSRPIAWQFLDWLAMPPRLAWLEVGCGTGALTGEIVRLCDPASVVAVEPSEGFVARARENVGNERVEFRVGDAGDLGALSGIDVAVSALVLNFVPDRVAALREMRRVVRPGGTVAVYVWDYPGGGVEFMRAFWRAAVALDPAAAELTEDRRFPFCTRDGLVGLVREAGFGEPEVTAIESRSVFRDFEDYWRPFTMGAGPAPGYCVSLPEERRQALRDRLASTLPRQADGTIDLGTRAWALRMRAD
jgi:SAM-dependent methyltransferase